MSAILRRSSKFRVYLDWLMPDGSTAHLEVRGSCWPYRPATGPTMEHAGGDPPEGGELEDLEIRISGVRLYEADEDELLNDRDFADKVREMLEDR